ncbi:YggS family pyridoxal phosphate-dependent enzyme [Gilvimarinus polysaccharolyticus]|uniref:YggS family pyridoxal phosphate-dependent enzyme n=1 Tax=Gilvimarinus polysaccharolyticus TaxID=863921 RepID=UPI0006732AD0|nr:YggS family pyridoxal phosphate-dependent enzyme [Gilvimarinus polysaccharolyticus]
MHKIDEKLANVTARIAHAAKIANRNAASVALLAVSKTQPAHRLREAYQAGVRRFGENYLQEALEKQNELNDLDGIEWHFIGPIQSNKTRAIAEHFSWAHSVDRLKIAQRLNDQRPTTLEPLNICLQVNIDNEPSKSGVTLAELTTLAEGVAQLPNIALRGLMTIPAPNAAANEHHPNSFARTAAALKQLKLALPCSPLDTLSMGMSADLEPAIASGATIVRIGTDIFGTRLT